MASMMHLSSSAMHRSESSTSSTLGPTDDEMWLRQAHRHEVHVLVRALNARMMLFFAMVCVVVLLAGRFGGVCLCVLCVCVCLCFCASVCDFQLSKLHLCVFVKSNEAPIANVSHISEPRKQSI